MKRGVSAEVQPADRFHDFEQLLTIWMACFGWAIDGIANAVRRTPSIENLERVTRELYEHAKWLSPRDALRAWTSTGAA